MKILRLYVVNRLGWQSGFDRLYQRVQGRGSPPKQELVPAKETVQLHSVILEMSLDPFALRSGQTGIKFLWADERREEIGGHNDLGGRETQDPSLSQRIPV